MTRKYYIWKLYNKDGELIACGRKGEVVKAAYGRYVYELIFTDKLVRTNDYLVG